MYHEFCCKSVAGRIKNHLPHPMGRELLDHIIELTQSISNFPRILNRDLRSVLQHARVSSPNAGASNVFRSGIPYALDSDWQFITPVYTVFFRTQQRIPIPLGGIEEIMASILSQNRTHQGYLRYRQDQVREIATVAMDEPDDGMNLGIFNAERALLDDQQLEVVRSSYHTQKLSQAHILCDQLAYPLIFWTGSSGCGVMESEKLQGCMTLIRKVLISLILQPQDHFIHELITLREEFICAIFGRLVNLNIKFIAQAQRRYFAREDEILDQNPEGTPKEYGLRVFIPPSLTDSDEYWRHVATKCFAISTQLGSPTFFLTLAMNPIDLTIKRSCEAMIYLPTLQLLQSYSRSSFTL
jgi:hypothetical protein